MPPLAISKADLRRLVEIVADSIRAASSDAYGEAAAIEALPEPDTEELPVQRAA
jgi:hypothetical protein